MVCQCRCLVFGSLCCFWGIQCRHPYRYITNCTYVWRVYFTDNFCRHEFRRLRSAVGGYASRLSRHYRRPRLAIYFSLVFYCPVDICGPELSPARRRGQRSPNGKKRNLHFHSALVGFRFPNHVQRYLWLGDSRTRSGRTHNGVSIFG